MIINFKKTMTALLAVPGIALLLFAGSTSAAHASGPISIERKIAHFGSPVEWQTRCVKWAKPWPGAKICVGHAYENLQHKFFLRVRGPAVDDAIRGAVEKAVGNAVSAALAVGLGTPSPEPAARIGAAITAAKIAFATSMGAAAGQYHIRIDHETAW